MYLEVQTGRGRMHLLILHNSQKYIVETKIWEGERSYTAGKKQLAAYVRLEEAAEGYYVKKGKRLFDHRKNPEQRMEFRRLLEVLRSGVTPSLSCKNCPHRRDSGN